MIIKTLSKENVKDLIDKLDINQIENIEVSNEIREELISNNIVIKRNVLTIVVNHNKYEEPIEESYLFR